MVLEIFFFGGAVVSWAFYIMGVIILVKLIYKFVLIWFR